MKIGKPVDEVPPKMTGSDKYGEVWNAVRALPDGQAIPVEFEDLQKARSFYSISSSHHDLLFQMRGKTVYVSRRNGAS